MMSIAPLLCRYGAPTFPFHGPPTQVVASVVVTLASGSINVPLTTQATATAYDAHGVPIIGRTVAWSTSNSAVATVSGSGLVTAVGAGSASIIATVDAVSGSTPVVVSSGTGTSYFAARFFAPIYFVKRYFA
jgi:uncharacterized protein YjdB